MKATKMIFAVKMFEDLESMAAYQEVYQLSSKYYI